MKAKEKQDKEYEATRTANKSSKALVCCLPLCTIPELLTCDLQGKEKAQDSDASQDSMLMDIDAGASDFEQLDSDEPPPPKKRGAAASKAKAPAKAPAKAAPKKAPAKGKAKKVQVRLDLFEDSDHD